MASSSARTRPRGQSSRPPAYAELVGKDRDYEGDEPWHGTIGGYTYHRCRGPRCREANRQRESARMAVIKAERAAQAHEHCLSQVLVERALEGAQKRAYTLEGEARRGALEAIGWLYSMVDMSTS